MCNLFALKSLFALVGLLLVLPLSLLATTYEPSTAISLDFRNLNPPVTTPAIQGSDMQIPGRSVQLTALPQQPTTWRWQLRSPFAGTRYSTVVMRYRATGLQMPPAVPVLRIESAMPNAVSTTLPVFTTADLVQDGRMRELRKDLGPLPDGALIVAIQFTAAGAPAGGTLEIFDVTFETGSHPAATISVRAQEFFVTDNAGRPVAGAEVHYGLLERSNWVTVGRTDSAGKVRLTAPFPVDLPLPAEATVEKKDYSPEFIAPINPANAHILDVKLQPTSEPVGGSRPANMLPPPAQPTETTAPPVPSDYYQQSGYSEPYDYGYSPAYPGFGNYGFGWPAGFAWFVVVSNGGHHHADCRPHSSSFTQNNPSQSNPPGKKILGPPPVKAAPVSATPGGKTPVTFGNHGHANVTTPRHWSGRPPTASSLPRYASPPSMSRHSAAAHAPSIAAPPGRVSAPSAPISAAPVASRH
jgi:hypothetical protein